MGTKLIITENEKTRILGLHQSNNEKIISEQSQNTNVKEIYVTKLDQNYNLEDANQNPVRFKFTITNSMITNDTNEGFKENLCVPVKYDSIGIFSGNTFYPNTIETITFKDEGVKKLNQDWDSKLRDSKFFCKVTKTDDSMGYAYFRDGQGKLNIRKINYYSPDPFKNIGNVTTTSQVDQKSTTQSNTLGGSDQSSGSNVETTYSTPETATKETKIEFIQTKLNDKFNSGLKVDSKWGPKTAAAVKAALESLGKTSDETLVEPENKQQQTLTKPKGVTYTPQAEKLMTNPFKK